MVSLSIVIASWNCRRQIETYFNSMVGIGLQDFETIVIDANSKDGTREYLESVQGSSLAKRLGLKTVLLDQKSNWCRNNELGIAVSEGDWLCISNPDIVLNPSFRDLVEECYGSKEPKPIVFCQLVDPRGHYQYPVKIAWYNIFFSFSSSYFGNTLDKFVARSWFRRNSFYRTDNWLFGPYLVVHPMHPAASLFLLHKEALKRCGGKLWREGYTWAGADSDMLRRAEELTVPIKFYPTIRITHEGGYSSKPTVAPPVLTAYEYVYGFCLYSRYWSDHSRLLSILFCIDSVFLLVFSLLSRKNSLRSLVRLSVARLRGVIDSQRVRLVK